MDNVAFTLCVVPLPTAHSTRPCWRRPKIKTISARAEIDVLIGWIWFFAKHYKTVEEINISAKLLKLYMTEDQTSHFAVHEEMFRRLLTEFMTPSYLEKGHTMFDAYMPGMTLV